MCIYLKCQNYFELKKKEKIFNIQTNKKYIKVYKIIFKRLKKNVIYVK